MISIINIPVSASEADTMTSKEYRVAQSDLIDKYANGDITFTEFQEQSQAVTNEYISKNTVDGVVSESALTVGNTMTALTAKMANAVKQYGDDTRNYVKDWWDSVCNKNNVPTETTQTSTTDMRGFGARLDNYVNGNIYMSKYGDYIVVKRSVSSSGFVTYSVIIYPQRASYVYPNNPYGWTSGYSESYVSNSGAGGLSEAGLSDFKWYGDVRYEGFDEGTEPPPNDEFVYGTIHNFDNMNDKQINDLLNDFSEELELQNPDLSNVNGLLSAIYSRLGTLDSDDDNAMLSAINTAIISLSTDTKASSAEIIELLKALKDKKAEGADLDPILKQLKDINKSLDYLKTVNTLDLVGDTIESLLELTDSERTFLDEYANIIISLTAKLGYAPVTAMISNLEAIMLNGNPPQDIVTTIYDTEVVLLSSSAFDNSQISSALNLAKLFVSVLLAISWLYAMRKKITGGA